MNASVYIALFISVLFSAELTISSAVGQLEESKVLQNDFNQEILANAGLPKQPRSSGLFKPYQLLEPDKVNSEDLGFGMDPKIIQPPFMTAGQRLFKRLFTLHEPMKKPLYLSAKRMDAPENSNQLEQFEMLEAHRANNDGENGALLPVGRRDFDMLRCMLGRVYRPCWQN
ncbi:pro-MCH [Chiloscyllium plagiosum]|uniref:pro-MCH n=1 Tax=Chiloscyllium plagiosum TaxID=36176 RepID=UPI001CB880F8|nr:pro-MCH [Chiloscyllium plagiosum]